MDFKNWSIWHDFLHLGSPDPRSHPTPHPQKKTQLAPSLAIWPWAGLFTSPSLFLHLSNYLLDSEQLSLHSFGDTAWRLNEIVSVESQHRVSHTDHVFMMSPLFFHPEYVCVCVCVLSSVQLFVTPTSCSPAGSSVHCVFPGKNIGVGCHFLLQRIFLTQGYNLCLLHWQANSFSLSHPLGTLMYSDTNVCIIYWSVTDLQPCVSSGCPTW